MQISWKQALTWRMRQHYLIERASPKQLVAVVDRLRGLHAQVMSSVDLALWARIDGLQKDAVADALWKKQTLIKVWAMRATGSCSLLFDGDHTASEYTGLRWRTGSVQRLQCELRRALGCAGGQLS